jgi:dTDP-4-amino-4,6-dideoxygalactose transaminase
VPADAAPGSLNTSAAEIRRVMTERTAAIVVAHIGGVPVDMDPIIELAAEHGIPIVEDCAQALGAVYRGRMAGSLGTISAFSTMFGKQHCTGAQGGVVFTTNTLLFARARQVADRGKPHGALGTPGNLIASLNFNQDELSMAIGRVQLAKLPAAVEARRRFVAAVARGLRGVDAVEVIGEAPDTLNSPWFLMLRLDRARVRCDAAGFAAALLQEGIDGVQAGYPFYPTDQPWHRDGVVHGTSGLPWSLVLGPEARKFELLNAHAANAAIVRVDVHEALGPREARDLVAAIRKIAAYYAA